MKIGGELTDSKRYDAGVESVMHNAGGLNQRGQAKIDLE